MKVTETSLPGVLLIEPKVFGDSRGFFVETYHQERYTERGIAGPFVQNNLSLSVRGVIRGLHLQNPNQQGKLVQVLRGEIFDVAVDVRVGSPTYGQWTAVTLSSDKRNQVYIPPDFAHGFAVLSDEALISYQCTDYYTPKSALFIRWDDPDIGIDWPFREPSLSTQDEEAVALREIDPAQLPSFAGTQA